MTRFRVVREALSLGLIAAGVLGWQPRSFGAALEQAPATPEAKAVSEELKIVVIEGEDGVNIVKKKTAVKPVVEVRDRNNLPVAGAYVTFLSPHASQGVTFLNGANSFSLMTNQAGRAVATAMRPFGQGAFKLTVTAAYHGQTATAAISQVNYATLAAAQAAGASGTGAGSGAGAAGAGAATSGGLSGAAIGGIVAGVAAAAAVVAKVVAKGNSTKPSTPATPSATIGAPGTPTIGAPK